MTKSVRDIIELVRPPDVPAEPATVADWQRVEIAWRTPPPEDLKEIVSVYGTGHFGNFLSILNPAASKPFMNNLGYETDLELTLELYRKRSPFAVDLSRLLPIGCTINGDELFFGVSKDEKIASIVLAESRAGMFETYDAPLSDFLIRWLRGHLRSKIISSPDPTFAAMR